MDPNRPPLLTPEQEALVAANVNLAAWWAFRFARAWPGLEQEFVSECMLNLCHAARKYDPAFNVPFGMYCPRWFLAARKEVFRRERPRGYRGPKTRGSAPKDGELTGEVEPGQDYEVAGPDDTLRVDDLDEIDAALDRIRPRYGAALRLRYLDGLSFREVGEALGCSEVAAASLERDARRAVKPRAT